MRLRRLYIKLFIFCTFITLLKLTSIYSQNYIKNGDFEFYKTCPDDFSQFYKLERWFTITHSPDYYNCEYPFWNIAPTSSFENSGNGYVGILTSNNSETEGAEGFSQELFKTLTPKEKYSFCFKAKKPQWGLYASDCTGVELYGFKADIMYDTSNYTHISLNEKAIYLGTSSIIRNQKWKTYSIEFTAPEVINYIAVSLEKKVCGQYIFLDSLSLVPIIEESVTCTIFPNPSTLDRIINIDCSHKIKNLIIFDINGNIYSEYILNSNSYSFQINNTGVYFLKVKTRRDEMIKKIIMVEK